MEEGYSNLNDVCTAWTDFKQMKAFLIPGPSKRIVSFSIYISIAVAHVYMNLSYILPFCPDHCGFGAGV